MALRVTTWRPDTCDCEIAIGWDDDKPPEMRTHTFVATSGCIYHAGLKDAETSGEAAHADNVKKNRVVALLTERFADVVEDIDFGVRFDPHRTLVVSGVSKSRRAVVRQALHEAFDGVELEGEC